MPIINDRRGSFHEFETNFRMKRTHCKRNGSPNSPYPLMRIHPSSAHWYSILKLLIVTVAALSVLN